MTDGPLRPRAATDPGLPPEDWDLCLRAVTTRLRDIARGLTQEAQARSALDDSVHALDLLQAALTLERTRRQRQLQAGRVALAAARDAGRAARHQAGHDGLTALPNGQQFRRRLDDALHRGTPQPPPLAVLYLDLDDFKPVNDRHGHGAGDQMLRAVARRLQQTVRQGDVVCRLGGDEFACLLAPPASREQLDRLAGALVAAVSAPLTVGATQLRVQPSIGIAVCPDDGRTARQLLQHADAAMYRAKRGRLGYTFFDPRHDGAGAGE